MTRNPPIFFKSIFRWRSILPLLYFIACGTCFLTLCVGLYRRYLDGTVFDGAGWMSIPGIINFFVLILSLPVALFLGLGLLIETCRKKRSRLHFLSVLVLPACVLLPYELGIPGFMDGVTDRFRKVGVSNGWVEYASREIARHGTGNTFSSIGEYQDWKQVISAPPFDKMGFQGVPRISSQDSSLVFRFGGPMGQRWGFSISGIKGKEPALPSDSYGKKMISTEVVLFDIPNY